MQKIENMKDYKLKIKSLLLVSLLFLGMNSCSEEVAFEDVADGQEVSLMLTTRASGSETTDNGTSDENSIQTLRAIVFEVSGSTYIRQVANQTYRNNPKTIEISYKKCDNVRVLLIANEKTEWNLNNTAMSADAIKDIQVSYGSWKETVDIKTPIIMFGESETLTGRTNTSTAVQLLRNLARVDLNISCNFQEVDKLENGKLTLRTARIERMAPTTGLTKMIDVDIDDNFLTGTELVFTEGGNFQTTNDGFTTLGNGNDNSVTFYVPEYNIKNAKAYSYIYITGAFTPNGSQEEIKVAYTIPIGGGITTDKVVAENFDLEDVLIERNNLYKLKATIKSIQQINEINVDVLPWTDKDINGSIETPKPAKLNVSNLYPTVAISGQEKILVQFWSDQSQESIRVLPQGTVKGTSETFNVNDIFVSLADTDTSRATNLTFESGTQWGRLTLTFISNNVMAGKTYIITLAAGPLQRTIEVTAVRETENQNQDEQ